VTLKEKLSLHSEKSKNILTRFNVCYVKRLVKDCLEDFFDTFVYSLEDNDTNQVTPVKIARKIRDFLKDSNKMPRYKYNVQVFFGERKEQKVTIVAKGYWDHYLDNYATVTHMGDNFYCTVIVWGFYYD
jgi:hypothetical protein